MVEPNSVTHCDSNRVGVDCRSGGRLGRHATIHRVALCGAVAACGNRVGTYRIAPNRGTAAIAVERISDRVCAIRHFASSHRRTCSGARVQPDIVGRRVRALDLDRGGLIDVCRQDPLAAEIVRRRAIDSARGRYGDLRRESCRRSCCI